MDHLDEISIDDLHRALDVVERKKGTQRLLAAIAYKNGISQSELASWHGVQRRTIYNWLERFETGPIVDAVRDDDRPGRPRKLDGDERSQLVTTLRGPPSEVGYDAPAWTPALVQQFLDETYDVKYSIPSCRRLLKEPRLRYQPSAGSDRGDGDADTGSDGPAGKRSGQWTPR